MSTLVAPASHSNPIPIEINRLRIDLTIRLALIASGWFLFLLWSPSGLLGQRAAPAANSSATQPYLTPNAIKLAQQLREPCDQSFENWVFDDLIELLAKNYQVTIWIDRRIPIDTLVTRGENTKSPSLQTMLEQMAMQVDGELAMLDNVAMIVPLGHRDGIERAYWQLVVGDKNGRWSKPTKDPFDWSQATSPTDIANRFFKKYPMLETKELQELALEHDLWPARRFQSTCPIAIALCLLSGFDLTLERNGNYFSMASLERNGTDNHVVWGYDPMSLSNKMSPADSDAWNTRWPSAKRKSNIAKKSVEISAPPSAHRELASFLLPPRSPTATTGQKVLSGRIQSELEEVLRVLSVNSKITFQPLPLPPKLAKIVIEMELDKATLDDILKKLESQSGITFRQRGNMVDMTFPK